MATPVDRLGLQVPEHRVARRAVLYWGLRQLLGWSAAWLVVRWVRHALVEWRFIGPALRRSAPEILLGLDRLGVALVVVGLVLVIVSPPVRYQIHRWQVGDDTVYVRDGLLRVSWRITPTARIQAVHLRRDLLELLLGLSTLVVASASSNGPLVVVGLDRDRAARVADELERVAARALGEAT